MHIPSSNGEQPTEMISMTYYKTVLSLLYQCTYHHQTVSIQLKWYHWLTTKLCYFHSTNAHTIIKRWAANRNDINDLLQNCVISILPMHIPSSNGEQPTKMISMTYYKTVLFSFYQCTYHHQTVSSQLKWYQWLTTKLCYFHSTNAHTIIKRWAANWNDINGLLQNCVIAILTL